MRVLKVLIALLAALISVAASGADLVTFQAESGVLGADWAGSHTGSPGYITIQTDGSAYNPGNAARVATYAVTFPAAGTYQLYARVRVGPGNYNDDSLFIAASFGSKSPASNADWVLVNGLAGVGYTADAEVVDGAGVAGSQVWKWINLSQFAGHGGFAVSSGNLTQTFQIGARENGLDLDEFAFGTVGTGFTVSNLDTGTLPALNLNTNLFIGPDGIALHRFGAMGTGFNLDGANPASGLALVAGMLCGTTLDGGRHGAGTAFYLDVDGTNFAAFHSFADAPDPGHPAGALWPAESGFLGATLTGGTAGVGTVFFGNTNGSISMLHSFAAVSPDNATNSGGASPAASPVLSGDMLYGTTTAGGAFANGTVFSVSTNGSGFAVLHEFSALDANAGTNPDGALPDGGLMLSGNTLYGTASAGGAGGAGVIFSLNNSDRSFKVLHSFSAVDPVLATNADGAFPCGRLVLFQNVLFGCTRAGGPGGRGVIFSVHPDGADFKILHHFSATDLATGTNVEGASPGAGLSLSGQVLYGTTAAGGSGAAGTVFSLNPGNGRFATLHHFGALSNNATNQDGAFPVAPVLLVNGSLFGTTFSGGPGAAGTVFSLPVPAPPAVITNILRGENGATTIHFVGGARSTNVVQFSTSLVPPVAWVNVSTNVADAQGTWWVTGGNLSVAGFYCSYAR